MRGTEKQIVFAEKLIERFNHQMDELIRKCPEQYKNDWIARKEKISMILQESYAGDVIHILNINEKPGKIITLRSILGFCRMRMLRQ